MRTTQKGEKEVEAVGRDGKKTACPGDDRARTIRRVKKAQPYLCRARRTKRPPRRWPVLTRREKPSLGDKIHRASRRWAKGRSNVCGLKEKYGASVVPQNSRKKNPETFLNQRFSGSHRSPTARKRPPAERSARAKAALEVGRGRKRALRENHKPSECARSVGGASGS